MLSIGLFFKYLSSSMLISFMLTKNRIYDGAFFARIADSFYLSLNSQKCCVFERVLKMAIQFTIKLITV